MAKSHRMKVLEQKIARFSPFETSSHYVIEESGQAMVWLWDEKKRIEALQAVQGNYSALSGHLEGLRVIPEPLLHDRNIDGAHSQASVNGSDIQTWKNGVLISSEWSGFKVAASVFNPHPWMQATPSLGWQNEALWWRATALALLLMITIQSGAVIGWLAKVALVDTELTERRESLSSSLEIRNQARSLRESNEQFISWFGYPKHLLVIADFDDLLPESSRIERWDYKSGELTVTVTDEDLNNREVLQNLASGQYFSNVSVEPGARVGSTVLSLDVHP